MMRVVLIPSIGEYKEAGIFNQVWHDEEELRTMKQEAIAEVKVYMSLTGEQHPGRAIRSLYK